MTDELKKHVPLISIGGGALAMVVALLLSIHRDSQVALAVAEQHGGELLLMRGELKALRDILEARTIDRYTSNDARADKAEINQRLYRLERFHDTDTDRGN